jgi:hypothetical protein
MPLPLPLIGEPTYTLTEILAYLDRKTSHPDRAEIARLYYSITHELAQRPGYPRLNPVPFIFQAMHETGFFTSWWFNQNKNLAGLGVTGTVTFGTADKKPAPVPGTDWAFEPETKSWVQGLIFFDWPPAVYAHLYHALAYCQPQTDFGSIADFFDNRYHTALATRKGKPGAKVLTDFNGSWAYPGALYGQRIEAIHAEFYALDGSPAPTASPADVLRWIALDLAAGALNSLGFFQNQLFYNKIYGELAALEKAGVISDWPHNLEVQNQFYKLRNELVDRADALYPAIKAKL